jgi:hypothetical protein
MATPTAGQRGPLRDYSTVAQTADHSVGHLVPDWVASLAASMASAKALQMAAWKVNRLANPKAQKTACSRVARLAVATASAMGHDLAVQTVASTESRRDLKTVV